MNFTELRTGEIYCDCFEYIEDPEGIMTMLKNHETKMRGVTISSEFLKDFVMPTLHRIMKSSNEAVSSVGSPFHFISIFAKCHLNNYDLRVWYINKAPRSDYVEERLI